MANVGVVTVTYRSASTIGACLQSLRAASAHPVEIVVVDNASGDASVAIALETDPAATVIAQPKNTGYGAANNAGVAALAPSTDVVVFANPDTVWPAGSIDALVARLDPTIGLISPFLVAEDGAIQPIVEHDFTLRETLLAMVRVRPPIRPGWVSAGDDVVDVEWLHTAAAVMPMIVVRELGGFDERFFVFAEDADLCRRVRALGKRVVITPRVVVNHAGGASFAQSGTADDTAALRTRALATYLEKYQGKLARRAFGAVGAVVYGLGGRRGQAREAWRALSR